MKKLLIVYYSWSCGNTERTAKALQSVAGGDLVRLDTAVPYSGSYNDVVDQGQREVNVGFEPELKPLPVNVADYDVIAVGDKKLANAQAIVKTMNEAGFDVTPVEMDLSSRSSIKALIAGGRGTARSRCWSTLRVCRPVRRPSRRS